MKFFIATLVGLMVLPVGAAAPLTAEASQTGLLPDIALPQAIASPARIDTKAQAFTVKLTAYNAVPGQTDSNPLVTASGAFSNSEVVAARSRDLGATLPYGTVIKIERASADTPSCRFSSVEPQIGYRVIADAMNPRIYNTIDVLLNQHKRVWADGRMVNPALAVGRCDQVTITVVGRINVWEIPSSQAALAAMVDSGSVLAYAGR